VQHLCPGCRHEAATVIADRDEDGETPTLKMHALAVNQHEREHP
jgi:hypothetical protein